MYSTALPCGTLAPHGAITRLHCDKIRKKASLFQNAPYGVSFGTGSSEKTACPETNGNI
jgi:hypothetical protein